MTDPRVSRRAFLEHSGTALGGAWLAAHWPTIGAVLAEARRAAAQGLPFEVLTADEAAELEAIAIQIFPTDETPGAREAGVIHFIDRALAGFAAGQLETLRTGLADLAARVSAREPGATRFAAMATERQTALLKDIESTPFFGQVWWLTVLGMFADPSHGGNRDQIGWRLLGFDPQHRYDPPFGYYDREANGNQ